MTNQDKEKALELACAANHLANTVKSFREAQHRVMFQMTNPSLSFPYEFQKSGEALEALREELNKSLDTVGALAWHVIYKNSQDKDNA
jgi:hypothetical protein